ncbi:MAG TPA: Asp-tRNA(Asn)/Glu-tRNA(Gln) amidotransferase subunit GatC [Microbacteriaceae bacterium]|nr:Asp-tRNA(Asn)/Glu-tRNA(Gln) amidotransferase subunit GatC [Microbacteriaceae bacterium]
MRHLGSLARIELSDEEITRLTGQLDAIVDNIAKVSEVATADVVATSHPIPLANVFRDDVVGEPLTIEQALQNAPDTADGRFRVTAIMGDEQ